MSSLKPDILVNPSDLFVQTGNVAGTVPYMTQTPELGVRAVAGDGREYRYAQAGATALVIGTTQQAVAPQSNYVDVTAIAAAVGATTVTLTVSTGTAVTTGQFSGGYYMTYGSVANGGGQILRISSNTAVTASGTSITITLEDPVQVAITTSATVNIIPPQFAGIVQTPSTPAAAVVGIAVNALTASYYGWIQVKGVANCLIQGTPAINLGLVASTSTAGALAVEGATTAQLAMNLKTGVDGRYGPVNLLIS